MPTKTATGAEQVTWDLSDIYEGPEDPRIEADTTTAIADARKYRESYRGKVATLDAKGLRDAIAEQERIYSTLSRIGIFHQLRFTTDMSDAARGAAIAAFGERATEVQTQMLFFELEWLAVDDARAEELTNDPVLAEYRHHLISARRYKNHVLSESEETVLTEKDQTGSSAWVRLFEELDSQVKVNLDGEEMSFEQAASNLHKPDRDLRKRTSDAITEALQRVLKTRTFIFNTLLLDKSVDDRLRSYPSWISSRNLANETSDEAVDALIEAVTSRYDIPQRFYKLKAKLLGIDDFTEYDRYAPLSTSGDILPWDKAREIVVGAYRDFEPKVGDIIEGFFTKNWIDAAPGDAKASGAFCATTIPGVHPYMLMTYTGERRSVLTLAHELGHGMHGVLAGEQGLFNANTTLTMAETASVFGEALTFKRLLNATDDTRAKLDLLLGRIDDAVATVFRQIAMNRFEDAIHAHRREKGELSAEDFNSHWISTQNDMFGDSVRVTENYHSWWSYVSHFVHSPGYVYAYAFGHLFSLAIYGKYQQEGDAVVPGYLELLAAGGSDAPDKLAAKVGLDITDPNFWAAGLEAMDADVTEAERLAEQL